MKCPHGNEIEAVTKMGIKIYRHTDGNKTPCPVLNTGVLSVQRLNKTYIDAWKPEISSKYVKATIADSGVQAYVVERIGEMELEDIKVALHELHNVKRLPDDLIVALHTTYGPEAIRLLSLTGIAGLYTPDDSSVNHYYSRLYCDIFGTHSDWETAKYKNKIKCLEGVE